MKKTIYTIISLLCLSVLAGCSDDKGNYDYKTLNTITIKGLQQEYSVDQYDTLCIDDLTLSFALEENADLAFEWVVDKKVVSTERRCRGYITTSPRHCDGYVCVTDRTNNLKYYQTFDVTVSSPYKKGLYLLSETADGTAKISIQRRDRPQAPLMTDMFEFVNPDFGALGRKPVQIACDVSGWNVNVLCREGERKLLNFNPETMLLKQYWNETSIIGTYTGEFTPEYFSNNDGRGMVLSEGKLFMFNFADNKSLYVPIEGYNFSWVGTNTGMYNTDYYAYDEDSQELKHLEPGSNAMMFDKITALDELNTAGQTFLASGMISESGYDNVIYPVLYDPATATEHYYEINIGGDYDNDWNYVYYYEYSEKMQRPATLDKGAPCLLSNANYWYASKGDRVIRYFFSATSVAQDWFSDFKGEVTAMTFDKEQDHLIVAVYDGAKTRVYDLSPEEPGEQLNEPLVVDGKVVSMCAVGTWKY